MVIVPRPNDRQLQCPQSVGMRCIRGGKFDAGHPAQRIDAYINLVTRQTLENVPISRRTAETATRAEFDRWPVGIGKTHGGCKDKSIMRPFSSCSSRSSRPSRSESARSSRPPFDPATNSLIRLFSTAMRQRSEASMCSTSSERRLIGAARCATVAPCRFAGR